MNLATFLQALAKQGAEVESIEGCTRCRFLRQNSKNLFFSVWVYEDGECTLATHLKGNEDTNLAYRQFEMVDFSGSEELFMSVLKMVETILQFGLHVKTKTGVLFQQFTATFGNGEEAFSNSYFRYGGFQLHKMNGAVGSIEAKNA